MRALPLQEFSIFDFDAYGSPWEHAIILCARRRVQPGERLGLVLTLKLRFGAFDDALATLVGFQRSGFRGLDERMATSRDRALAATRERLRGRIVKRYEATGKTGTNVHYVAVILDHRLSRTPAGPLPSRA